MVHVSLLTGGGDKPYALGMVSALASQQIRVDYIGSDEVDAPALHQSSLIHFLNLRGAQRSDVKLLGKALRVLAYYCRLVRYAATAEPRIFHILWNDRLKHLDRTALMLYFKVLGKKVVFTAHNVNAGKRDGNDSVPNRLTLRVQYRLADHIFVHTERMKQELLTDFATPEAKVSVIPFGINRTVRDTEMSTEQAKRALGLAEANKTLLFFGHIAPYKGLEVLIEALHDLVNKDEAYRLIIAGSPKGAEKHWEQIQKRIVRLGMTERILERIEFIPDDETELYFKAADVLILPYSHIFQSGVLSLGYNFGLPVIASDVGSLREDIVEGKTGYLFKPGDPADLARKIRAYFSSPLFLTLEHLRPQIRDYANDRYSWDKVGEVTKKVYGALLEEARSGP